MIFTNKCYFAAMEHEKGATPELLDTLVDKGHRSYMSAVRGISLGTFRARVPMSTMPIHRCWILRCGLYVSHIFIISVIVCYNLIFYFRAAGYALRVFSRLRDLSREICQTVHVDQGTRLHGFGSTCPCSRHFSTIGVRRRTRFTFRSVR